MIETESKKIESHEDSIQFTNQNEKYDFYINKKKLNLENKNNNNIISKREKLLNYYSKSYWWENCLGNNLFTTLTLKHLERSLIDLIRVKILTLQYIQPRNKKQF